MKKYVVLGLLICLFNSAFASVAVRVNRTDTPSASAWSDHKNYLLPNWSARNKEQSELFFASNKLNPDINTLPNGLQYKIIKGGVGDPPSLNDSITVTYQGRFIQGYVFDNNYNTGKTLTVPVANLIPGWKTAVQLMKPGAIWELYIPSNLAYGAKGIPGLIGPNMTLIYMVHLYGVKYQANQTKLINGSSKKAASNP